MRILFVDDEAGLQDQAKIYLERLSEDIEVLSTSSAEKAFEIMGENDFDVIVSDYKMPGKDGLEFLKEIREERGEDIPFIIFTGQGGEKVAIEALNLGADRYIQKSDDPESQYELLVEAIEHGYEHGVSKKRLKESDQKLRESRKKYQKIFYGSPIGAFHYDGEGIITECNDKFVKIIGASRKAVMGLDMLNDLDNGKLIEEVRSSLDEGEGYYEGEYTTVTGNKTINVRIFLNGIEDEDGQINTGIGLVEDNTERKDYERELKRKERYLDSTPTYIAVIDEEGEMRYHSYPSNKIKGLDPRKFMGTEAFDFVHPDDREDAVEMFSKVIENPGEEYRTELRGKAENGWIWLEIRAVNYLDDPEIDGIVITAQDVSKRKEAEEELRKKEKKYRSIFEQFQDLYYRTDAEGIILELSPSVTDLSGYDRDELMGEHVGKVYSDPKEREDLINELSKNGEVRGYEIKLKKKSGETAIASVNSHLVKGEDGEVKGVEGTIRDITEKKKIKEREEFLHSLLRHDIKNKAQAVQGYLQLLQEGEISEDTKELAEGALKANKETVKLIQKVRLLLDAQEEEKKPVNIKTTIKKAVKANESLAKMKGVDMSLECPSSDCQVEGGSLLEEVFYNIIENSVQHSGGDKITIVGDVYEEEIMCIIQDDGKGIPDDKKDIIFEKGYTTDEERGTGLGLFLVKILLDIYGGSIEIKNSDMGGARFEVTLKKVSQDGYIPNK